MKPHGLFNAPGTLNRLVAERFRPYQGYAETYSFDDMFANSRAGHGVPM